MRSLRLSIWDPISLLSVGAAAAATWIVYDRLPNPIPTHFDLHGNANGWMPRVYGAWFVPVLAIVLWAVVRFASAVLPRRDKQNLKTKTVALFAMMTTVLLAATHVVILYVAVNPGVNVTRLIFVLLSIFFVGIGLVMPRLKRNPIMGVRTKWTLTSDENWARTHRVAGYSMVIAGILGGLGTLAGGMPGIALAMCCYVSAGIVPAIWSFMYARRQDPS